MKYVPFILFFLMVALQWYIPLNMIKEQETVLTEGTLYKFKMQPIDPADPFRGRYIVLDFEAEVVEVDTNTIWSPQETIYVLLDSDDQAFATVKAVVKEVPQNTDEFVQAQVHYGSRSGELRIKYPFDRYYMEESKAPKAEQLYRDAGIDSLQTAYALVRVKKGQAALQDVMINDRSIHDILSETKTSTE